MVVNTSLVNQPARVNSHSVSFLQTVWGELHSHCLQWADGRHQSTRENIKHIFSAEVVGIILTCLIVIIESISAISAIYFCLNSTLFLEADKEVGHVSPSLIGPLALSITEYSLLIGRLALSITQGTQRSH